MKFTFTDDYDAIVTSVDLFTSSLKSQLSTQTGIPEASIRNLKVEKGNNDDGCQFPCWCLRVMPWTQINYAKRYILVHTDYNLPFP